MRHTWLAGTCQIRLSFRLAVSRFADLAGAEASPLQGMVCTHAVCIELGSVLPSVAWKGCEKFVLKFPQQVLGSFIDSFAVAPAPGKKWKKRQLRIQGVNFFFC